MTAPKKVAPEVHLTDGKITTNSLTIAKHFGKQHKNILQAIENLEAPKEFIELNFKPNEYKDKIGRKLPCFEITRDGFSILVMGFTGAKAMDWKISYLEAFNLMEQECLAKPEKQDKQITSAMYEGTTLTDAPRMEQMSAQQHWDLEQACEAAAQRCNQPVHVVRGLCCVQFNARYLMGIPEWKFTPALNYVNRLKPESGCFKDAAMFDKPDGNDNYQTAFQCIHQLSYLLRVLADEAEDGKDARERLAEMSKLLLGMPK